MTRKIYFFSAASITIPGNSPNDEIGDGLGMVADGTKCGAGKVS